MTLLEYAEGLANSNYAEGVRILNTPKAFANFSPRLERSDNPG